MGLPEGSCWPVPLPSGPLLADLLQTNTRSTMKTIVLGNAGAGKSTLSRKLLAGSTAARLCLDDIAFRGGSERRPLGDSIKDLKCWIERNPGWVIEGCYSDIIEPVLALCDELIFLNPGVEACIRHCRARPWEPDKFSSREAQDEYLENLIEWVRTYEHRADEYGLSRHRALYDAFSGKKREFRHPREYESP